MEFPPQYTGIAFEFQKFNYFGKSQKFYDSRIAFHQGRRILTDFDTKQSLTCYKRLG